MRGVVRVCGVSGEDGVVPIPEASLTPGQRRVRKVRRDVVGEALRGARIAAGLTQQALSDASGVSRPAIARIETGEASVQIDRLWDLAEALHTTPSALLSSAEELIRRPPSRPE